MGARPGDTGRGFSMRSLIAVALLTSLVAADLKSVERALALALKDQNRKAVEVAVAQLLTADSAESMKVPKYWVSLRLRS